MDNVLGRSMFKLKTGSTARDGLAKMQNALIRGGYDKSYVFRLGPTQVMDLYDYMYGSGEGKDYSAPTPKMEGGPVKLAEGGKDPQYEYALEVVTSYTDSLPFGLKQMSKLKNMLRDRESVIGFADMILKQKEQKLVEEEKVKNYPNPVPNADGGMADGRPMDTENVGIMDGVGIGAEAIMQQEQAIDQAQDIEGLMGAIRGKPVSEGEAREELAELVGPEDAQQTPDSVLALVQPVMELAKGQGIAQFVEEAEVPEAQLATGGPVHMALGGTQGYRGYEIPDLRAAFEQQYPIVQDIMGVEPDSAGLKSDILFQIAAGGLNLARQRKPGEPVDPMSLFAESFTQPLQNIGALTRDERMRQKKEDQAIKGTALGLAQDVIAGEKSEVDAEIELAATVAEAKKEAQERDEDLMADTSVYYNSQTKRNEVLSKKDVIDIKNSQGSAFFTENFLPQKDFKVGSYEVIDRETGESPTIAPTGRMDLVFDEDNGKYFYREKGTNNLLELPSSVTVSAAVSSTATAKDTAPLGGKVSSMYVDAFGAVNQISTGVTYLDDIYDTTLAPGAQAGFVAGLKKKFQSFASAAEDIGIDVLPIYNDLLELTNQAETAGFDNVVNQSLAQQEQDMYQLKQSQLDGKTLSDDDKKALADENAMKAYLSGRSHIVRNKDTGELEIQALPPSFIDEDLFKNAVKINSLIYAVARARKPTGRLNVDDIKKASEAIQLYQGGERGVQAALRAVREELADAGQGKVKELIQVDATRAQYDDNMAVFGVTEESFNAYKDAYIKALEGVEEGEYVNISKLPNIFGGYSGTVYDNPLTSNFTLQGSGEDKTESMNKFLENYGG